jgi:ATP-binding cassette subfamily C protein CydD
LKSQSIQWLNSFRKTAGACLGLSIGLGFCSGVLLIVQASVLSRTIYEVIFKGHGLMVVMPGLWFILGLVFARSVLMGISRYYSGLAAARVKEEIRRLLFEKIERIGPVNLSSRSAGDLVNLGVDGVEALDGFYSGYLPQLALAVLIPPAILVFIFPIDWISGLILMITAPLIPFFMIVIGSRAEKLNREQWQTINRLSHRFLDAIQGLVTLKMFNAGKREAEVVGKISEEYGRSTLSVLRVAFLSALALEFMATVSVAVVAVIVGFRLLWGQLDFGAGFFILILAPEFYLPLRSLGTHFHSRMSAVAAAEHMQTLLKISDMKRAPDGDERPFERVSLRFDQVSYCYETEREGLKNLSFVAPAKGLTCLTGESGRGKTTALRLILGLIQPDSGKITVNDVDLLTLGHDTWLKQTAYLPQKPHLLSRSVLDNIRLGNARATVEEVKRAAIRARLDKEIEALPDGYDTILGEDGQDLSGGQRQRLALARAFVRNCPLVLLDEPGAGLDKGNRVMIYESIMELARSRAVIMVTHDMEILPRAVRVIALQ